MDIKEVIKQAAINLEKDGVKAAPDLREVQENIRNMRPSDIHIKFLCFFLESFIDDVFYNLTGDFPHGESSYEIRVNIFKEIGKGLQGLADKIGSSEGNEYYEPYLKIVEAYLKGIAELRHNLGENSKD